MPHCVTRANELGMTNFLIINPIKLLLSGFCSFFSGLQTHNTRFGQTVGTSGTKWIISLVNTVYWST